MPARNTQFANERLARPFHRSRVRSLTCTFAIPRSSALTTGFSVSIGSGLFLTFCAYNWNGT